MREMKSSTKIFAWAAAIFTVMVWGETFVSTKILLNNGLTPPDIFFYRFVLAYACMCLFSHRKLFSDSLKDELLMVLLGITGGSLYFLAENSALGYSTASNVSILVGSAPIVTTILVGLCFKDEKAGWRQVAGSLMAFAGMALVVLNGKFHLHINPLGDTLAICAAALWGVYSLIMRFVSDKYDVRFITRKIFAYGLLTMGLYFLTFRRLNTDLSVLSAPVVWGNLLYLGIVASFLCYVLWNWSISILGAVRTTDTIYGQSFFTMLVAAVALGEKIRLNAKSPCIKI